MQPGPEYLTGHFPEETKNFSAVPEYSCDVSGHFLQKEALHAWLAMHNAAKKENISLRIISSLRSFERQKRIWENKWTGKTLTQGQNIAELIPDAVLRARTILKFSAMPGTSRHHWGTDFDINALEDDYFLDGKGKDEYSWLNENANNFKFAQPYSVKGPGRPVGYEEEKWHWSYLPLSKEYLKIYLAEVNYNLITGFEGSDTAEEIRVIEDYVNGIDSRCR